MGVPAEYADLLPASNVPPEYADLASGGPRIGHGPWDAFVSGQQGSGTGLLFRGKLPDVVLDHEHAKWYENAIETLSGMAADVGQMITGVGIGGALGTAVLPGFGTAVGQGAGSMAVPAAIRESLIRGYQSGEINSSSNFLDRVGITIKGLSEPEVLKATGKAAIIGGLTFGSGRFALPFGTVAKLGAEAGTLAVAPAALEGRLPEPWEIANAAVVLVGMKAATGAAGKIADIYAKTGRTPEDVVADAKTDPTITEDLKRDDPNIPRVYRPIEAAENARLAIPEPGARARAFVESPFAEVPQKPGEPKVELNPNYDYINTSEDAKAALARASQLYGEKILQQTRGKVSWRETEREGAESLAEMIGAKDVSSVAERTPGSGAGTTEMYLRGQLMLGAVEDFTRRAQSYDPLKASPEDALKMLAAAERVGMLSATFQGAAAETGRALNALKMVNAGLRKADAIGKLMEGTPDPAKVAMAMQRIDNPVAAAEVARLVMKPKALTTNQKFIQVRNFALLFGLKVPQVKAIGDAIAYALAIIDRVVATGVGKFTPGFEKVDLAEAGDYWTGSWAGGRHALRVGAETWKFAGVPRDEANAFGYRPVFGEQAEGGEPSQPPEAGSAAQAANLVVSIPHRIIGAETEFFREFNKAGEARALASRQARSEGLERGTNEFALRVRQIEREATGDATQQAKAEGLKPKTDAFDKRVEEIQKRQAEIDKAGAEATFTAKLGQYGKALHALKQTSIGGYIIPFDTVPANLVKWAVARIPGAAFVLDNVREDFAAGGARRDIAIARQAVGASIATAAYLAVKNGVLTGGGMGLTPEEKESRRDAGIQDYSIKFGDTYYGYNRFEPIARIASLSGDIAEISDKLEKDDKASLPAMLAFMFGHALVSQTYLSGLNDFIKALDDPVREMPRVWNSFVGSWVPALFAQVAAATDKDTRRVDSAFDAVKNRIPIWRETLLPRINPLTGEPIESKSTIFPVDVTDISNDPVLMEAARLKIGIAKTPKSLQVIRDFGTKEGKAELTPEQQNLFASTTGALAHQILFRVVGTEAWNNAKDVVKKQIYAKVFAQARQAGAVAALPGEQRAALAMEMADKLAEKLQ